MKNCEFIEQAKEKIASHKNQTLTLDQRIEEATVLTASLLQASRKLQTYSDKKREKELAGMLHDPIGKAFVTVMTDRCFRSHRPFRIANQLAFEISKFGVPLYLPLFKRIALNALKMIGQPLAPLAIPLVVKMIRDQTATVILPGETKQLLEHIRKRHQEGIRVNLNHLGEAILGEEEAERRLNVYLEDLANPEIEYISIKISTIYSQINLLSWEETIQQLAVRLRKLYRVAQSHTFTKSDGSKIQKFVNLDMEEYRDLHLTVDLFKRILEEKEFFHLSAGIVLQSYLPDSYRIQLELTEWAKKRVAAGGAPIKIRIVKGANLAMEKVDAALHGWPQAPFSQKHEVDANYKKMMTYGCQKENAKAVHLGIASHNLFDICYALLLRAENGVEESVCFEMLEGMADSIRCVVQAISGEMVLYCPAAKKDEFQNAVAYLVRRLDENSAPENFLRYLFDLKVGSEAWKEQTRFFEQSAFDQNEVHELPRRTQNRFDKVTFKKMSSFENEADTDWSLIQNRKWAEEILRSWRAKKVETIPLVINGIEKVTQKLGQGEDPSCPGKPFYSYSLADLSDLEKCLHNAELSLENRMDLLANIAHGLRTHRGDLIGAMVADTGKTVFEADVEVSEAIDFAEYYRLNRMQLGEMKDIEWKARGTILVASPWNFPCSIPAGGILAALAAGNRVIFKPAPEAVLVGWVLVNIFWDAGVSKKSLQFFVCEDDSVGTALIADDRIDGIILTGSTDTAKHFLRMRSDLHLMAETGGKNIMLISAMSDRDLAIKDLVQSAFGHAGQKCSACSLAILEAEIYDDPQFRRQLKDAVSSLKVGSAWDLTTKVNPLIHAPGPILLRGLTQLEEGEEWLLKPVQDPSNPNLWSPGIKLGVQPNGFTFQNELFGPVIGLVRAKTFPDALKLINRTRYGLTAGLHSLDEREQSLWLKSVDAGNCYVNRTMTGAIVQRQPFGGCKESSFGRGAKAGGPNYLIQLMEAMEKKLPSESAEIPVRLRSLMKEKLFKGEDEKKWLASLGNYIYHWNEFFSKDRDPSLVLGQDNFQRYVPHQKMLFRIGQGDSLIDILRVLAASYICGTLLDISCQDSLLSKELSKKFKRYFKKCICESEDALIARIDQGEYGRIRLLQQGSPELQKVIARSIGHMNIEPVYSNGRIELLNYLREVTISIDYHRYGNLGVRENEKRHPLL